MSAFDNDDAMDWLAELEAEGLPAAGGAIQDVLELDAEYLESPICANALAAAEVIAALRGRPAIGLPEQIQAWLAKYPGDPGAELVTSARIAVETILVDSELAELWSESDEAPLWRASVSDLHRRLS